MPEEYTDSEINIAKGVRSGATLVSLARIPMGTLCAIETLCDITDPLAVVSNAVLEVSDQEGRAVRKWGEAYPTGWIKDVRSTLDGIEGVAHKEETLGGFLLSINGSWVDERADKWAQHMRKAALVIKGRIHPAHLIVPFIRDVGISDARELYGSMGVKGVESAKLQGQLKTTVMGGAFILAASNFGHNHKKLTDIIFASSTALSITSGVSYIYSFEKAYLEKTGSLNGNWNKFDIFTSGLHRTIEYGLEKRKKQAYRVGNTLVSRFARVGTRPAHA